MQGISLIVLGIIILIAFINAKIYNIPFGIITLVALAVILDFIMFIGLKADVNITKFSQISYYSLLSFEHPYIELLLYFKLTKLANTTEWLYYVFTIGIWIIAFFISAFIRKFIKNR